MDELQIKGWLIDQLPYEVVKVDETRALFTPTSNSVMRWFTVTIKPRI